MAMRVEATQQAMLGHTGNPPHDESAAGADNTDAESFAESEAESRALVATEIPAAALLISPVYREAAFLAHLLATKAMAPQTRERRRAEPEEAIAAYSAVAELTR
jgi:hypothetical protein